MNHDESLKNNNLILKTTINLYKRPLIHPYTPPILSIAKNTPWGPATSWTGPTPPASREQVLELTGTRTYNIILPVALSSFTVPGDAKRRRGVCWVSSRCVVVADFFWNLRVWWCVFFSGCKSRSIDISVKSYEHLWTFVWIYERIYL